MKKINLTESEKDRIRGLHNSHKNQHGTLIKETPTGAAFGHGFKQDEPEQDMGENTQSSPQDWKMFWTELGNENKTKLQQMLKECDDDSLKTWMTENSECEMMNIMQNPNCQMSFEKAVNLTGVLTCLGVKSVSALASGLGDALKVLGTGISN